MLTKHLCPTANFTSFSISDDMEKCQMSWLG